MKFDINSKIVLKILSGLVALVLWFAITYTEDPIISQHLGDIPIVFENEEELADNGLAIINKKDLPDISATIRGKRSSVISAMSTIVASCDVSGIESAGENSIQIKYVYPTATITMAKIKTRDLVVETEKLIERDIPIEITIKNADKNSEFIVNPICDTDAIRIKGAETDVYSVSYASVVVDVAKMTENNTQEYMFDLCDKDGAAISEENIVSISKKTVSIDNRIYKKAELPVKVKLSEELEKENFITTKSVTPEKIEVGVVEELGVTEIVAEIGEISEGKEYELVLTVPDGIYLPEGKEKIKATCEIFEMVETEKEVKVEILNKPDSETTVEPEKIRVRVRHPESMSDIKLKATVDMAGVEEGKPVAVSIDAPDDVEVLGKYSVNIR